MIGDKDSTLSEDSNQYTKVFDSRKSYRFLVLSFDAVWVGVLIESQSRVQCRDMVVMLAFRPRRSYHFLMNLTVTLNLCALTRLK